MRFSKLYRVAGAVLAAALLSSIVSPAIARAGTTGSLGGTVTDSATQSPIAGAQVSVASPSQTATVTTDNAGHFVFISLAPDTYTLTVAKSGYDPSSLSGVSVFADQSQSIPIAVQKSLKEIARVTSRSSLSPVRSGTGTDVYSVNAATTAAAAPLGGGGGLNNAYSAIAAMPGAYVPPNQVGVNQSVYIRGGYYDQIGFEYDGVPVNRSFDNYPANSESTLGQQELEIYTGGGGADANATGLSGFINQVIKTGTYPGFGTLGGAIAAPAFYHDLRVEAGGSSPDRLFSYYAGLSGTNQDFRYFDQFNGADLVGSVPYGYWPAHITSFTPAFYPAMYPNCNNDGTYTNPVSGIVTNDPGCFGSYSPNYGQPATVNGREAVANFHFAIPHRHDSGRDDLQILAMSSANYTQYYTSLNDAGPLAQGLVNDGNQGSPPDFFGGNTNQWPDFYTFPANTGWLAPASTSPIAYLYPGSPTARCANVTGVPNACPIDANGNQETVQIPANYRDGRWDTANIAKIQYQKNIGDKAYVRLFGYTFYSNSNEASANGYGNNVSLGILNFDYEVDSHTRGAELQFADQINSQNQLSGMASYLTSTTLRYYNHNYNFNNAGDQVSNFTNGSQCFATTSGAGIDPNSNYTPGFPAPCNDPISQGSFSAPYGSFNAQNPCADGEVPSNAPACTSGATMALTYLGNNADLNTVTPKLTDFSLTDEWRPNDKLYLNASVRFERDAYDLANTNSAAKNFWFAAAQKEFCVNPVTLNPVFVPQPPQSIFVYNPYVTFNCPVDSSTGTPVQTVHPDGTKGVLLTNNYPSTYSQSYTQPRFSATYTVNPDTVLRVSAGRYAQQPQNYEIQYNSVQPNLAAELLGFVPFGFNSPLHQAQAQFSNNYDLSYERHFRGTDMSIKVTPYYRWATNQLYESVNLPSLGVSPSFNSGTERVDGLELEFTKGDFGKDGLAALFSYTLTNAAEKWGNFPNTTIGPIDNYNQDIQEFNALTKSGGGFPCYANSADGTPDPGCGSTSIRNPYYSASPQPLLDRSGWYSAGLDFPYVSPNTFSLVLGYRHKKFAFTPAMSLAQGTTYGSPADVIGIDPRACTANQGSVGITTGNPLNADYTSCQSALTKDGSSPGNLYIPNPQTGSFDSFGQFRQPWQFNLGVQISYDVTPHVTANVVVANLVNRCFGGSSEPWTKAYPPNGNFCGYTSSTFYNGGGFYNGSSPNDLAANGVPENPYFAQSFVPAYGDVSSGNYPLAPNVYFSLTVKL